MWSYDLGLRSIRFTVVKVVVNSEETCCLFSLNSSKSLQHVGD